MERQEAEKAGPASALTGAFPVTLTAGSRGGARAEITLDRRLASAGVTRRDVQADGVVGTLFTPASPGPHPAVIVLAGSGGGAWLSPAALLASRGYAALALGDFRMPGLPHGLVNIPIEYFEAAITRLPETVPPAQGLIRLIRVPRGRGPAVLL